MSYSIKLCYDGEPAIVDSHTEGSLICIGGSTEAAMDITYNYGHFYHQLIDAEQGIRWLYGQKAEDTIFALWGAIAVLGTYRDEDYYAPTPGNAGYALSILLSWAEQHPDAVWEGD